MTLLLAPLLLLSLDGQVAAVADRELVVVVPRIDRVAGPISDALRRLEGHPELAPFVAELRTSFAGPTDLAEHERLGLRPDGALVAASGPALFLPLRPGADVGRYLEALGAEGAHAADGTHVKVASTPEALKALDTSKPLGDALAGCPRKKGDADLFAVWSTPGLGRGCLTARFDPDRVRLDARFSFRPAQPLEQLLAPPDEGLVAELGADATAVMTAFLADEALRRVRQKAPQPWVGSLTGGLVVGAGPAGVTLAARVRQPAEVAAGVKTLLQAQAKVEVAAEGDGWRVRYTPPGAEPSEAWIGVRGDTLLATTARTAPAAGDFRARLDGDARVDGALLKGASASLYLRIAGPPHDGSVYADALTPAARAMGIGPERVQRFCAGVAYVLAHLSEVAVAVRRDGADLVVAAEVVTL